MQRQSGHQHETSANAERRHNFFQRDRRTKRGAQEATAPRGNGLEHERRAAVQAERRRVAREIHDTLGQGLAAMLLQVELAEDALDTDAGQTRRRLRQAQHLGRLCMGEARRAVWALRSPAFREAELPAALRQLATELTSHTRLKAHCSVEGDSRPTGPETEYNLLRIAQEAVANAVKHARARKLNIALRFDEEHVRLSVEDDGRGIPRKIGQGHAGLLIMRERAQAIGARLTIASGIRKGTRIEVITPLERTHPAQHAAILEAPPYRPAQERMQ